MEKPACLAEKSPNVLAPRLGHVLDSYLHRSDLAPMLGFGTGCSRLREWCFVLLPAAGEAGGNCSLRLSHVEQKHSKVNRSTPRCRV
jgi:hypothetical protein